VIGKKIGRYSLIELLGSGGNANVYRAKDNKGNQYAVKILKVGNYPAFRKKYNRFKDEVRIVRANQTVIPGILPIIECSLPNNPYKNTPWYSMPIATPIVEILNHHSSINEIMQCIEQLSSTLIKLHEKGIVHRDIKPNNLYFYKNNWSFGDFGLVEYPRKTDLTAKGESVGPKYTIAPEMKRDAKNSDGKAADIYSLAKTLWILLTGVNEGFEGQYSDNIEKFNIASYREHGFLVTIHNLLMECTSNIPSERPSISVFNQVVNDWFLISRDFKRKNILEWEYIYRKILPNTTPEAITWTSLEDIIFILNLISKIDSLNHVFMPGGGGLDLTKCTLSNEPSYIELHFDHIIKKLKPKKLHLNSFTNNPKWNYFLLETEEIEATGLYPKGERYYESVLELSPGVYVEPYHKYYEEINGEPIPQNAREVMLSLKGSYAIFAKGSTYNGISGTYDGRHDKMTSSDFYEYIKSMIRYQQWANNNPDEAKRKKQERKARENEQREIESKEYERRELELKAQWEEVLSSVKMPIAPEQLLSGEVYFTIEMNDQYFENVYYISNENKLILDSMSNLERVIHGSIDPDKLLKINDYDLCVDYIDQLKNSLLTFNGSDEIESVLYFDVDIHRVKKPAHLFTKEELYELLINANDKIYNRVVIKTNGRLGLISGEIDYLELKRYVYRGWQFNAFENAVGKESKLHFIDEVYLDLLAGWCFHLENNRRSYQSSSDYFHGLNEDQLLERIRVAIEQYAD
jgi:serine/threonine protein kinase